MYKLLVKIQLAKYKLIKLSHFIGIKLDYDPSVRFVRYRPTELFEI